MIWTHLNLRIGSLGSDLTILYLHVPHTVAHVTGGYDGNDETADILEYREGEDWMKVGEMKNSRSGHGISKIDHYQFINYCK